MQIKIKMTIEYEIDGELLPGHNPPQEIVDALASQMPGVVNCMIDGPDNGYMIMVNSTTFEIIDEEG